MGGRQCDLFASPISAVCNQYFTKAENAFDHEWKNLQPLWANPPFRLAAKMLQRFDKLQLDAIVVLPIEKMIGFEEVFLQPVLLLPPLSANIFKLSDRPLMKKPDLATFSPAVGFISAPPKRKQRQEQRTLRKKTRTFEIHEQWSVELGIEVRTLPWDGKPFLW